MRDVVSTGEAPAAIGPYSQAIRAGGLIWVSGQIPLDPATGELVRGDVEGQTRQVMRNLGAILAAAGSGFERVVRATVWLTDMAHFETVNRVYAETFAADAPARVCIAVAALPKGADVEIDVVALAGRAAS